MSVKEHIGSNREKMVNFQYYRDGNLWYQTELGLDFPVPISDIGNATFLATDRAILFMRYINKHLNTLKNKEN